MSGQQISFWHESVLPFQIIRETSTEQHLVVFSDRAEDIVALLDICPALCLHQATAVLTETDR